MSATIGAQRTSASVAVALNATATQKRFDACARVSVGDLNAEVETPKSRSCSPKASRTPTIATKPKSSGGRSLERMMTDRNVTQIYNNCPNRTVDPPRAKDDRASGGFTAVGPPWRTS